MSESSIAAYFTYYHPRDTIDSGVQSFRANHFKGVEKSCENSKGAAFESIYSWGGLLFALRSKIKNFHRIFECLTIGIAGIGVRQPGFLEALGTVIVRQSRYLLHDVHQSSKCEDKLFCCIWPLTQAAHEISESVRGIGLQKKMVCIR